MFFRKSFALFTETFINNKHYISITMVMDTLQIRLSHGLIERIDSFIGKDIYANRSEVIRDAVRRFVWEREVGTISMKGSGVELVRKARKKLSKEKIDLKDINKL